MIALLAALPFSKLHHVLVRPLQVGARLVRAPGAARVACAGCGAALAPVAQLTAVREALAARGLVLAAHLESCPACRRRSVATTQARLVGASFQPALSGVRLAAHDPEPRALARSAA